MSGTSTHSMEEGSTDAPPIGFRGVDYRAVKRFFHGTHRCVSPEETLEKIRPTYRRAGLTRLADVTGLDRVGVTTIVSIRPDAASMVCSAGKGFTPAAAEASAAMEAIELFHAENVETPYFEATYEEAAERYRIPPPERLPLLKHSLFDVRRPESWALGWDLAAQEEVALPYSVIPLHDGLYRPWQHRSFDSGGSNGLASGNHFLEAVCAALYEVIERDAVACSKLFHRRRGTHPPRIDGTALAAPRIRELVERIHAAGIEVVLYDRTVDTDVPTFHATVYDRTVRHVGLFAGYGAHLDSEIAMIRAVTEALQSRLVVIAGARDDRFRYRRHNALSWDRPQYVETLENIPVTTAAYPCRNEATGSFEGDLQILLRKLSRVGHPQVIVFDLSRVGFDISVVRVVVPGFEGYMFEHYTPGPRALRLSAKSDRKN